MDYLETLAGQVGWATKNLAYNLDFVPTDKLTWKPAATANSVLEIVHHVVGALKATPGIMTTGSYSEPDFTPATNLAEAKQLIVSAGEEYAQFLKGVNQDDLSQTVTLPFGTFTKAILIGMPVIDVIHHHGQIAYVQTLLGDTESHFDRSLTQQ